MGSDGGVTHVAPSSTGEPIANPRFCRTDKPAGANAPCHWSNPAKGTPARAPRHTVVAHRHERIAYRRNDVAHSLSRRLVHEVGMIVVAELTIARLINKHTRQTAVPMPQGTTLPGRCASRLRVAVGGSRKVIHAGWRNAVVNVTRW
ncbi:transposase [Chloroflexus aggregans]|uniref:transposase n=1 Tax=Chloroflexus aggregans TaxID=152260 RepID=UPI0038B9EE47